MTRSNYPVRVLALSAGLALAAFAGRATAADEPAAAPPPATQPVAAAAAAKADAPRDDKDRPEIEVVFVLDTTGSMSGLIEGAKQKIWSIANTIIAVKDKPRIKIGLIGYRDRGDDYVTKQFDLTDDIDTVFKNLQGFQAGGGNDTPESVNQALHEAVTKMNWSDRKEVARIIFLVGDAPPHMDYKDDVKYTDNCAAAAKRDIVINSVQCGAIAETGPVWQEIAKLGKGSYIPLAQEGGMVAVAAPQDKELAELNAKLAGTVVAYGLRAQQLDVRTKVAANVATASSAADLARLADRAVYNSADGRKAIQGGGDLVWACSNGVVKLDEVKAEELPPELQKMSAGERKAYVEQKQKERDEVQKRIDELTAKRQAYVAAEQARMTKDAPASAFDLKVSEVVKEQAEAKRK